MSIEVSVEMGLDSVHVAVYAVRQRIGPFHRAIALLHVGSKFSSRLRIGWKEMPVFRGLRRVGRMESLVVLVLLNLKSTDDNKAAGSPRNSDPQSEMEFSCLPL